MNKLNPSNRVSLLRISAYILFTAACFYFVVRGPLRATKRSVDFPTFYTSAKAWLIGKNPYDVEQLEQIYSQSGRDNNPVTVTLNPPVTFPLLIPFALLPYQAAKFAMIGINVLLTALIIYMLSRMTYLKSGEIKTLLFWAFATAFAPFHTSVSQGQLTIIVTFAIVCILLLELSDRIKAKDYFIGLLLAVACCLKPQMAVVFALYYLLLLRWKVILTGGICITILAAISMGKLAADNINWLVTYKANLQIFSNGGLSDPASDNLFKYLMLNFQVLGYLFSSNSYFVNAVTLAIVGLGVGCAAVLARTNRTKTSPKSQMLIFSILSVVTVLGFYSRLYSATLLIFVIALAFICWKDRSKKFAVLLDLTLAIFLVPGTALFYISFKNGLIPSAVEHEWWWNYLVMPHQIHALLLILMSLFVASARKITNHFVDPDRIINV